MNFAVGGAGVFDTGNFQRNISEQIDLFEEQIKEGVFDKCELKKSAVALLTISGNDYSYIAERENSTNVSINSHKVLLFARIWLIWLSNYELLIINLVVEIKPFANINSF